MPFTGFVYLISIFGGFISDSYAGRFNTIVGSSVLYIIGEYVLWLPYTYHNEQYKYTFTLSVGSGDVRRPFSR